MQTSTAVAGALAELRGLLGARASDSDAVREHHSHGESYHPPAAPDIVCFPASTAEVSEVARISQRFQLPIVPFGAGTSLEGHVHALRGGISLDLRETTDKVHISRFNKGFSSPEPGAKIHNGEESKREVVGDESSSVPAIFQEDFPTAELFHIGSERE